MMPRPQFRLRSLFATLHRLFLSEPDPMTTWHERIRRENPRSYWAGVIPLVRFFSRFVTKIVGRVAYVGF